MLENIFDLYLKEIDKPNFLYNAFAPILIREKYIVLKSAIFYLYKDKPLLDGVLDMEELLEKRDSIVELYEDKVLMIDAFEVKGSH